MEHDEFNKKIGSILNLNNDISSVVFKVNNKIYTKIKNIFLSLEDNKLVIDISNEENKYKGLTKHNYG